MERNIFILLPAFNEEAVISELITEISKLKLPGLKIVIVDDGSMDRTVAKAEGTGLTNLKIIKHSINLGLGCAIKTGFEFILQSATDRDLLVTLDADGTHPPETIYSMIDDIDKGSDCVIASRFVAGGREIGLNRFRKILSINASSLIKFIFGYQVKDFTSGFRIYKLSILRKMKEKYGNNYLTEKGFACMAEILLKLLKINAKITEVPLILRYDLKKGRSKIKVIKTILNYFKMFIKIKMF